MSQKDILDLIAQDAWMMRVLRIVGDLKLPDCWVGAGFVRNKIWDHLHGYTGRTPLGDVDIVYFDPHDLSEEVENELQNRLKKRDSSINWSVTNQARMHIPSNLPPYSSTEDALSVWPETPTAVAVRLNSEGQLELLAPHGIKDLVSLVVNPTPLSFSRPEIYEKRLAEKQWGKKWPKLRINHLL